MAVEEPPAPGSSRLFGLLAGKREESGLVDVLCTVNRLLWLFVFLKWFNFEAWWWSHYA